MHIKNLFKQIFLLSILIIPFSFPTLKTYIIHVQGAKDTTQIYDYSVAVSDSNELFVVFREKNKDNDTIAMLKSNSNFEWNRSYIIIATENESTSITSKPSIAFTNESYYIAYDLAQDDKSNILLQKWLGTTNIQESAIIKNIDGRIINPLLRYNSINHTLWLSWKDNHEGNYNQYFSYLNCTDSSWSSITKLTEDSNYNCQDCDYIFDKNGDVHFVWSGDKDDYKKILYRKVYSNITLESIEEITDGSSKCIEPAIVLDSNEKINVFWSNYSYTANPGFLLGNDFIHTSIKQSANNWTHPLEVAPYIPPERPSSGSSDGYNPAVALDTKNQLWLAYEVIEEYTDHHGVDIRNRVKNEWKPKEFLSLVNARAYDPCLIVDHSGNLHCFWIDTRHITLEVYYRVILENGVSSEEFLLTQLGKNLDPAFLIILGCVLGGAIIISIPMMILNSLRKRRERKILNNKLKDAF